MKLISQQKAIATALGWTEISNDRFPKGRECKGANWGKPVPNYPGSLDLMHEAHETLTTDQHRQYRRHLQLIVRDGCDPGNKHHSVCHATAGQRAEAFLRTLNLWTDEES